MRRGLIYDGEMRSEVVVVEIDALEVGVLEADVWIDTLNYERHLEDYLYLTTMRAGASTPVSYGKSRPVFACS